MLILCFFRYVYEKKECYYFSEGLARYVTNVLRRVYKNVMAHVDSFLTSEGFAIEDATIGDGPFTSFAISHDHNKS